MAILSISFLGFSIGVDYLPHPIAVVNFDGFPVQSRSYPEAWSYETFSYKFYPDLDSALASMNNSDRTRATIKIVRNSSIILLDNGTGNCSAEVPESGFLYEFFERSTQSVLDRRIVKSLVVSLIHSISLELSYIGNLLHYLHKILPKRRNSVLGGS